MRLINSVFRSLKRNGEVGVYPTSPGNDSAPSPASWI